MNCILHINGWPGSGKRTIGAQLAARIGARLLDNHAVLNPAEALFERDDPLHAELREAVRSLVLAYAARVTAGTPLVLTDALSNDEADRATFSRYRVLAARRNARLVSIALDLAPSENVRRLQACGRAERLKLTRPDILMRLRKDHKLLVPPECDVVRIDVTNLSAEDAARLILDQLPS